MPIYGYICKDCDEQFEIYQSFEDQALSKCPECKGSIHKDFSFHISNAAIPTRLSNMNRVAPRTPDPAWERGIVTEKRAGGTEMPYLNKDGSPVRVKQYGEQRHAIEARVDQLRKDPTVLTKKG